MSDLINSADTLLSQATDRNLISELLADKRSENTRRAYKKDLTDFFGAVANSDPTQQLISKFLGLDRHQALSLVLKYKAMLIEKNLKEATINRRLAAIKSLVNYARKVGKCDYSLEDVKGEKVRPYRDTTGVSVDVFKKVLAKCDRSTLKGKRDYAILRLLWTNALRRNEVVSLDIKHFDAEQCRLEILGKGRGTSREFVTLEKITVKAILAWLEARGSATSNEPLFCAVGCHQAGHRLTGTGLYNIVTKSCALAGVQKVVGVHKIRHSSLTHALDVTGGDVRKVQRLSRHSKVETLMLYDDNRQNIQGEISNLLGDSFI